MTFSFVPGRVVVVFVWFINQEDTGHTQNRSLCASVDGPVRQGERERDTHTHREREAVTVAVTVKDRLFSCRETGNTKRGTVGIVIVVYQTDCLVEKRKNKQQPGWEKWTSRVNFIGLPPIEQN